MSEVKKPLVEAALGRKPDRYPVWFMRQAGRYLPEYMEIRSKLDFVALCKNPEMAAEVTIQPLRRYDLDGAIIFSDILIPCTGMGQTLTFGKGHGPQLNAPIRTAADLKALKIPNSEKELGYVGEAIAKTKAQLKPEQTMIGFAGAPFTVASYMIEGAGSKTYTEVKKLAFTEPEVFTGLLDLIAETTVGYLKMQIDAGADVVMLFDSWAAQLTPQDYVALIKPSLVRLASEVKKLGVPVIYFPGQGSDRMYELGGLDVDVIQVHWSSRTSVAGRILKEAGLDVTLQGNLDPQVLISSEDVVRQRTREVIEDAKGAARAHIFNVGHGLMPHIPPESLNWVIDELRR